MDNNFYFYKTQEMVNRFYPLYIYGAMGGRNAVKKPIVTKLYGKFNCEGVRDDTLRAFKIIKVIYINRWDCAIFNVKVAGLGEGYICTSEGRMYKSVENYENGIEISFDRVCSGEVFDCKNAIRNSRMATHGGDYMFRYEWSENKAVARLVYFMVSYDIASDSFCIQVNPKSVEKYPYATKEECYADNTTAVCDFEEDEIEPIPFEVSVEVKTTISVTAKSKKDAEESVYRLISTAQSTLSQVSNNNVGSVITAKMKR